MRPSRLRTFWLWLTGRLMKRTPNGRAFMYGPLWVVPVEETTGQDDPTTRKDWVDIQPHCAKEKRNEPS